MPRHFKVHELLSREELDALESFTREPGRTIDEIEQWLLAAGFVISRGAVWKWRNSFLVNDKMAASAELAKQVMEAAGKTDAVSLSDAATRQIGQILYERTVAMQIDGGASTKDIVNMTAGLKNLITGKRHLEDLKDEMQSRQRRAIAEAENTVKAGGTAEDAIRKMREVLGIQEAT